MESYKIRVNNLDESKEAQLDEAHKSRADFDEAKRFMQRISI